MTITVKYGTGNIWSTDIFPAGTSVGCVVGSARTKAALGYGQNVEGFVGGVPNNEATIAEGMTISVHDKGCTKAAR